LRLVPRAIYTIGHSNVSAERFLAQLAEHDIEGLADVRAFPGSRRHPHFARAALASQCQARGIAYRWMPALGGRRRSARVDSPHRAWQVPAFRAYADYMDGPEFAAALAELEAFARERRAAFMCAETLWWQCHRRLIADRLLVSGWHVLHIMASRGAEPHRLPEFARMIAGRLVYDGGTTRPLL
jgi:uncharacterized protein (DUF488 family)